MFWASAFISIYSAYFKCLIETCRHESLLPKLSDRDSQIHIYIKIVVMCLEWIGFMHYTVVHEENGGL